MVIQIRFRRGACLLRTLVFRGCLRLLPGGFQLFLGLSHPLLRLTHTFFGLLLHLLRSFRLVLQRSGLLFDKLLVSFLSLILSRLSCLRVCMDLFVFPLFRFLFGCSQTLSRFEQGTASLFGQRRKIPQRLVIVGPIGRRRRLLKLLASLFQRFNCIRCFPLLSFLLCAIRQRVRKIRRLLPQLLEFIHEIRLSLLENLIGPLIPFLQVLFVSGGKFESILRILKRIFRNLREGVSHGRIPLKLLLKVSYQVFYGLIEHLGQFADFIVGLLLGFGRRLILECFPKCLTGFGDIRPRLESLEVFRNSFQCLSGLFLPLCSLGQFLRLLLRLLLFNGALQGPIHFNRGWLHGRDCRIRVKRLFPFFFHPKVLLVRVLDQRFKEILDLFVDLRLFDLQCFNFRRFGVLLRLQIIGQPRRRRLQLSDVLGSLPGHFGNSGSKFLDDRSRFFKHWIELLLDLCKFGLQLQQFMPGPNHQIPVPATFIDFTSCVSNRLGPTCLINTTRHQVGCGSLP